MRKHPIWQMVAIGLVASAIGVVLALQIDWFPIDAAEQAGPIDTLYDVLLIVSVPIFVLVMTAMLYSVWAFRMRPGQEREDGAPIHGHTKLEIVWTAVPAILLVSLCSYAYAVLTDIEAKHENELIVDVTGQQFAWRYAYPQESGKPIVSTQLYLPKDRPVHFRVRSEDVIHDFWVPAFRMKIDAVPGITTDVRVTPTRLGSFPVVCAELCGLGHATMRSTARVVAPERFERWLREQAAPAQAAAPQGDGGEGGEGASSGASLLPIGKQAFTDAGCVGCHTLADANAGGTAGPNLDESLAGMDEDAIRTAIVDPDAEIAEGFQAGAMPDTFEDTLSGPQLDGLVAYLAQAAK